MRALVCVCVCVCARARAHVVCVHARVMFSGRSSFHIVAHVEALCSKMYHPKNNDIAKFIVTANTEI